VEISSADFGVSDLVWKKFGKCTHISMSVESSHTAVQEQHTCDDP